KEGRVLVGYVNGCSGAPCAQSAPTATGNAYTASAIIARQSSGRRLFAAFDPTEATSEPGMPSLTARRVGNVVHLAWSEADTGDTCTGMIIHKNDPTHPEANAGAATPGSLLIDYIAAGEPAGTDNFVFKMKVNDLSTVPANSRWRIIWNSWAAQQVANDDSAQQFYVGMTSDASGAVSFEYGTLADAGVPAVYVISETRVADALSGSK